MRPRYRTALVLETPERTPDGAGGHVTTWRALGTHFADLRPRTGREAGGPAGPVSISGLRILVRGCPPGSPARPVAGQRFRLGPRVFAILAVTEADPRGRSLAIAAQEEVAQ